jgi:Xaa-Pro aminopeptidase
MPMSVIAQPAVTNLDPPADDSATSRRADVDAKQAQVAALLEGLGCEGLIALEPENFAWLTGGATVRGTLDPADWPAVYFTADQRWLLCSNTDSQRLFDEELDGLGFQLKEWPWNWGKSELLAQIGKDRKLACDRAQGSTTPAADLLHKARLVLSPYEQSCLRALGQILSHALEATSRNLLPNEMEREVAGQLSHRLLHRGAEAVHIGVAADGRSRPYRQYHFTTAQIRRQCVLTATATKYGLTATATRGLTFGPPDAAYRREHDAACRVIATYLASTWPDAVPRGILATGRRVYQVTGFEHEWQLSPQGFVTGRAPVELPLLPTTEELFQAGWSLTWRASVGAASCCDTYLITDDGPDCVTLPEAWPSKRIRVQGTDFLFPDLLQR